VITAGGCSNCNCKVMMLGGGGGSYCKRRTRFVLARRCGDGFLVFESSTTGSGMMVSPSFVPPPPSYGCPMMGMTMVTKQLHIAA
jgi:hypothetical protein